MWISRMRISWIWFYVWRWRLDNCYSYCNLRIVLYMPSLV